MFLPALSNPRFVVSLLVLIVVTACATPNTASNPTATPENKPDVVITISGSGTVTAVLTAVQPALEKDLSGMRLKVLAGSGTSAAIKGVLDKTLDTIGMARKPKDEEAAQGLKYAAFGNASVAIIAHPELNISGLTKAQVSDIFFGKITNWSAVGGPDHKIVVYVRDEDESATQVLRKAVFGDSPFPEATTAKMLTSTKDMLTAVTGTQYSIGFASWPGVRAAESTAKAVPIDGILPKDTKYPWVLPLGIGYLENRKADVQPLIDWLTSERGRAALTKLEVLINQ